MNSLAFVHLIIDLSYSTSITSTTQVLAQTLGVAVGAMLLRFFSSNLNQSTILTTKSISSGIYFYECSHSTFCIDFYSVESG